MQSSEVKDIFIDIAIPSRPVMFDSPNNETYAIASKEGFAAFLHGVIESKNNGVPYPFYAEGGKHGDPDCQFELYKLYTTTNPDAEPDKEKAIYYLASAVANYYLQLRNYPEAFILFNEYVKKFGEKEVHEVLTKGIGDKKTNFCDNRKLLNAIIKHIQDPSDYELKSECKSILKQSELQKNNVRRYISTFAANANERDTALASLAFRELVADRYKDNLLAFNLTGNLLSLEIVEYQMRCAIEATQYLVYLGKTGGLEFNAMRIELSEFCTMVVNLSKLKSKDAEKDSVGFLEVYQPVAHLILGYLYTSNNGLSANVKKAYKSLLNHKKGDGLPANVRAFSDYLEIVSLTKLAKLDENFEGKLEETFKEFAKKYDNSILNNGKATTTEYFIAGYVNEKYKKDKVAASSFYSAGLEIKYNEELEYYVEKGAFNRKCQKRYDRLQSK